MSSLTGAKAHMGLVHRKMSAFGVAFNTSAFDSDQLSAGIRDTFNEQRLGPAGPFPPCIGKPNARAGIAAFAYPDLIVIFFSAFCASVLLGKVTVRTPLLNFASILSVSTPLGT